MSTIHIGIVLGWSGWQGPLLVNLEWVAGSLYTCQGLEALGRVKYNSFGSVNLEWVAGSTSIVNLEWVTDGSSVGGRVYRDW